MRETMNQTLELWKKVSSGASEEIPSPTEPRSSTCKLIIQNNIKIKLLWSAKWVRDGVLDMIVKTKKWFFFFFQNRFSK